MISHALESFSCFRVYCYCIIFHVIYNHGVLYICWENQRLHLTSIQNVWHKKYEHNYELMACLDALFIM